MTSEKKYEGIAVLYVYHFPGENSCISSRMKTHTKMLPQKISIDDVSLNFSCNVNSANSVSCLVRICIA